jgi:hypothetical protein
MDGAIAKCGQVDGEYVWWAKRTQYIEIDCNREIRLCYTWRGKPYLCVRVMTSQLDAQGIPWRIKNMAHFRRWKSAPLIVVLSGYSDRADSEEIVLQYGLITNLLYISKVHWRFCFESALKATFSQVFGEINWNWTEMISKERSGLVILKMEYEFEFEAGWGSNHFIKHDWTAI